MAITLAMLQARADTFSFAQVPNTNLVSGAPYPSATHPFQRMVPHSSSSRTAIAWSARYRTRYVRGSTLVVDTSQVAQYVQFVYDDAWTQFDAIDLNLGMLGVPPGRRDVVGVQNQTPGLPPGSFP